MVGKLSGVAAGSEPLKAACSVNKRTALFVGHCSADYDLSFHWGVTIKKRRLNGEAVSHAVSYLDIFIGVGVFFCVSGYMAAVYVQSRTLLATITEEAEQSCKQTEL